jgi:hypothetical protein
MVCETEFSDVQILKDALVDIGVKAEHIEHHEEARSLQGYHGDAREQRAHVIIRRQFIGAASNDIGFEKMANGNYRAWVSDFDKSRGLGSKIVSGEIVQHYAKRMVLKCIPQSRGHLLSSEMGKNGKVKIEIGY